MTDSRFTGPTGGSSTSKDPYGYFTAPQPAPPAAGSFGGPAQQGAPSGGDPALGQFGGQSPFIGQPPYAAPASRRRVHPAILVALALVVLVVGWFGWNAYQRSRPVELPTSFAGQAENTSPAAEAARSTILASMQARNPGIQMSVKIYGDAASKGVILGAARAREDVQQDLADNGLSTPTQVGKSTCATATNGAYVTCVRSEQNLTVVVLEFGKDVSGTAAMVDQAWGLL